MCGGIFCIMREIYRWEIKYSKSQVVSEMLALDWVQLFKLFDTVKPEFSKLLDQQQNYNELFHYFWLFVTQKLINGKTFRNFKNFIILKFPKSVLYYT